MKQYLQRKLVKKKDQTTFDLGWTLFREAKLRSTVSSAKPLQTGEKKC